MERLGHHSAGHNQTAPADMAVALERFTLSLGIADLALFRRSIRVSPSPRYKDRF